MTRRLTTALAALLLAAPGLLAGCGMPGTDGGSGMSQAEAQAFAGQLSQASAGGALSAHLLQGSGTSALTASNNVVSCTQSGSCTINESISYGVNCTSGGRIGLTGSLTGSMNSSGTGMLQLQITETITDWKCISNYVVNGDPYLSLVGQFSYVNGSPGTAQSLTLTGGFKWGSSSSESCQIYLTTNFGSSGHGTTSGTVCGYSVSASF